MTKELIQRHFLLKLRNPFGSGHGKSASYQGLEARRAKLTIGSSITFVDFIRSTYFYGCTDYSQCRDGRPIRKY